MANAGALWKLYPWPTPALKSRRLASTDVSTSWPNADVGHSCVSQIDFQGEASIIGGSIGNEAVAISAARGRSECGMP